MNYLFIIGGIVTFGCLIILIKLAAYSVLDELHSREKFGVRFYDGKDMAKSVVMLVLSIIAATWCFITVVTFI